jgi:signal transduction histidine kinase
MTDNEDPIHSRFLSVLSHDVRGAFHSVQLALDMLARDATDRQPAEQMLEDVELGRRAVIDATVRVERLLVAERLRLGVMPIRPHKGDIVLVIRQAAEHALIASAEPPERVKVDLPPQWVVETDPRLIGEIVGGLTDYGLRRGQANLRVSADAAAEVLLIESETDWLSGDVTSADPNDLDPAALGLYVARECARALGTTIDASARIVRVALPR